MCRQKPESLSAESHSLNHHTEHACFYNILLTNYNYIKLKFKAYFQEKVMEGKVEMHVASFCLLSFEPGDTITCCHAERCNNYLRAASRPEDILQSDIGKTQIRCFAWGIGL